MLRLLNVDLLVWVDALSWLMVVQVVTSQLCVWGAILTRRLALHFVHVDGGYFATLLPLWANQIVVVFSRMKGCSYRQISS